MNVKENMFLIKKIVTRFGKKVAAWWTKSSDEEKNHNYSSKKFTTLNE